MPVDGPRARAELLLLSPPILVPCLVHNRRHCVGHARHREYLNEYAPIRGSCRHVRTRALPLDLRRDSLRDLPLCALRCR